jgi:hypothetical protein
MLRWCIHQTDEQRSLAEAELEEQFGAEFTGLGANDPWRRSALITAQVVQDVQQQVWCREITLDGLLGKGPSGARDLRYAASILDRGEVDRLASEYLTFRGGASTDEGRAFLRTGFFSRARSPTSRRSSSMRAQNSRRTGTAMSGSETGADRRGTASCGCSI